jgi:putative addiction module component (TIGR02574 family)
MAAFVQRNPEWVIAMLDYQTLLADAARLPIVDRIQLIDALWDTLPTESLPPLSGEWKAEVQRRSAEFDSSSTQTVPWEQVRTDALRRVGLTVPDASR